MHFSYETITWHVSAGVQLCKRLDVAKGSLVCPQQSATNIWLGEAFLAHQLISTGLAAPALTTHANFRAHSCAGMS